MHALPEIIAGRDHAGILALAAQTQSTPGRHIYRFPPALVLQFAHRLSAGEDSAIEVANSLASRDVRSGLLFGKRDIKRLGAALRNLPN